MITSEYLAWKHRIGYWRLFHLTPWWEFKKKRRRKDRESRAIERLKAAGYSMTAPGLTLPKKGGGLTWAREDVVE